MLLLLLYFALVPVLVLVLFLALVSCWCCCRFRIILCLIILPYCRCCVVSAINSIHRWYNIRGMLLSTYSYRCPAVPCNRATLGFSEQDRTLAVKITTRRACS